MITLTIPAELGFNLPAAGDVFLDMTRMSPEVLLAALTNGFKQKVVDYCSGKSYVTGPDRRRGHEEMAEQLYAGTWNKKRGSAKATAFETWLNKLAATTAQAWVKREYPQAAKEFALGKTVERQKYYLADYAWVEKQTAKYVPPAELDLD